MISAYEGDEQVAESSTESTADSTTESTTDSTADSSAEAKAQKAEERAQKKEAAKAEARAKEIEEGEKLLTEIVDGGPFDVATAIRALTRRLVGDVSQVSLSTRKVSTWPASSASAAPEAADVKGKKAGA